MTRPRYRFGEFVVSPSQRRMLRDGVEVRLIPRYFDLLLLLLEQRDQAVTRHEILETVWSDVVVSDNALNQAVRSLRRALGDDPRAPRFVGTVSRHGYRFVHTEVFEEPDEGGSAPPLPASACDGPGRHPRGEPVGSGSLEQAMGELLDPRLDQEARLEAAARLHQAGLDEALRSLEGRPGHEQARALLRDARWDLPDAAAVPIWGTPGWLRSARMLAALRVRRAFAIAARRWAGAVLGGAGAGGVAGVLGGLVLRFGPGSQAGDAVLVALPIVGLLIGGTGAFGVGGGLAFAEVVFRSRRGLALMLAGAGGGLLVGAAAHGLGAALLAGLFGTELSAVAGGFEGLVIGAAVGLGYALATPRQEGGMASPRGRRRLLVALCTSLACGLATATLGLTGHFLGAMSLELLTERFPESQVGLAPLGRLLGEAPPGSLTAIAVSAWEGLWFGGGVAAGLTTRPHPTRRQVAAPAP